MGQTAAFAVRLASVASPAQRLVAIWKSVTTQPPVELDTTAGEPEGLTMLTAVAPDVVDGQVVRPAAANALLAVPSEGVCAELVGKLTSPSGKFLKTFFVVGSFLLKDLLTTGKVVSAISFADLLAVSALVQAILREKFFPM